MVAGSDGSSDPSLTKGYVDVVLEASFCGGGAHDSAAGMSERTKALPGSIFR